jgi:dTDP-4-dehydrorhamnose 3,5-epimerase
MNFFTKKKIEDTLILQYKKYNDERGFFAEVYKKKSFAKIIKNFEISQINFSKSRKNVVRGLHFQLNPKMSKAMRVVSGSATFLALDIRKKKNRLIRVKSNDRDNLIFWAPYYYARGFIAHEDNTIIEYFCDGIYSSKGEYTINLNNKIFKLGKKLDNLLISKKDKLAQSLDEWFIVNKNLILNSF